MVYLYEKRKIKMNHELDTKSKNEHGKPIYPRLITNKEGNRVRVFNAQHEMEEKGIVIEKKIEKEVKTEVQKSDSWS